MITTKSVSATAPRSSGGSTGSDGLAGRDSTELGQLDGTSGHPRIGLRCVSMARCNIVAPLSVRSPLPLAICPRLADRNSGCAARALGQRRCRHDELDSHRARTRALGEGPLHPERAGDPHGYVGVSIKFNALHEYTGRDSGKVNPILVGLLRALAPGQSPVIRIGGNSEDHTWWPVRSTIPPRGVRYTLTPDWLAGAHALAAALNARMIPASTSPPTARRLSGSEARARPRHRPPLHRFVEIGNEPDVYSVFPWFRAAKACPSSPARAVTTCRSLRPGLLPLGRVCPACRSPGRRSPSSPG